MERPASLGKITTRPSVAEDSAFMLELYASTSKDVLDDLGWSIGSQRTFVIMQAQTEEWNRARLYPGMDRLTICVDEMPVGRLLVCMRNNILHLVDLSLLPRFRGNGIGTQLLTEILDEARNARVPVKVKVFKGSSAVRFVERLGFATPTDLGRLVELTWMPPLAALGPDAREDGFSSVGTRAHRSSPVEETEDGDTEAKANPIERYGSAETVRVAHLEAQEIAAEVELAMGTAAATRTTIERTAPLPANDSVAEEAADSVTEEASDDESYGSGTPDEVDAISVEHIDEAEEVAEVADPVNEAVQHYLADVDAEYLVEPTWLAPEPGEVEDLEEEEPVEEEEEDPEVAARQAEFRDSVAATDEFTAGLTANFSADLAEDQLDEDEPLPYGADRYDPFA